MTGGTSSVGERTPFGLVAAVASPVEVSKRELVRVSRELEQVARTTRPPAVAAALQDARFLTDRTRAVYASLAEAGTPGRLLARGMQSWLAPGVVGVDLDDDDPLVDEWVIVVPGTAPVALAAADLSGLDGDGADDARSFRYAVTRDSEVVAACARALGIEIPAI